MAKRLIAERYGPKQEGPRGHDEEFRSIWSYPDRSGVGEPTSNVLVTNFHNRPTFTFQAVAPESS
jgi:hypothetical protein